MPPTATEATAEAPTGTAEAPAGAAEAPTTEAAEAPTQEAAEAPSGAAEAPTEAAEAPTLAAAGTWPPRPQRVDLPPLQYRGCVTLHVSWPGFVEVAYRVSCGGWHMWRLLTCLQLTCSCTHYHLSVSPFLFVCGFGLPLLYWATKGM